VGYVGIGVLDEVYLFYGGGGLGVEFCVIGGGVEVYGISDRTVSKFGITIHLIHSYPKHLLIELKFMSK
jgi:hypothetical protein